MPSRRVRPAAVDVVSRAAHLRCSVLAPLLGVHKRTIRNIRYRLENRPLPYSRVSSGRVPVLSSFAIEALRALVDEVSAPSLRFVRTFLRRATGHDVKENTLQKILSRHRISRKFSVEHRAPERNELLRQQFVAEMRALNLRCCTFIDETGFTRTTVRRSSGWSSVGSRAIVRHRACVSFKHITLLLAMNHTGIVAYSVMNGGARMRNFECFVLERIAPQRNHATGENTIVVLDNAKSHKNAAVRARIAAAGIRLKFLPPYSCDMNPIECLFSPIKLFIRSNYADYLSRPVDVILGAVTHVQPQWCMNSIKHMPYARGRDDL